MAQALSDTRDGARAQGAELQDREWLASAADARLREQRCSAVVEPHRDRDSGGHGCEQHAGGASDEEIKGALAAIRVHTPGLTQWLALAAAAGVTAASSNACSRRRSLRCLRRECSINGRQAAAVRRCLISRCQKRFERLYR